ncbi:MAG: hypothetical protein LBH94_03125 [Deltaproteobacteria bacterium]|jgi:hypothetical protein|nr:hypothetical protein [Deltaproteobacteria bacterium]
MTADDRYSLLLMRDNSRAYRWRIGLRLFRAMCCTIILMPLLLFGACWVIWLLYQDNAAVQSQLRHLEEENQTLSSMIKRLSNLEQLLDMSENAKLSALKNQQAKLRAAEQSAPPLEVPPPENPKDQNQGDAISLDALPPPSSANPTVDLKCVGIENFLARRQAGNLRISLDLHNILQKSQIGGYVSCTLKSATGEIIALDIPRDVAAFRISRFKRFVFSPTLPAAQRNTAAPTLVLEITLEERGVVYRNEYLVE